MADSAENIQTYRKLLKLDRRSRVFALLAEELCASGEWEEAAEVCKKGLLFHPDHLRARVLLGWALMEMGEAGQSERILLNTVEDIRKNSLIFKLSSMFAVLSGNTESAEEYERIYEAFQAFGSARNGTASRTEPQPSEHVLPPKTEVSELDNFKAETPEELEEPVMETVSDETSAQLTPGIDTGPKLGLEEILVNLAQRIEERFDQKVLPDVVLSENDKDMLKQRIVAALSEG